MLMASFAPESKVWVRNLSSVNLNVPFQYRWKIGSRIVRSVRSFSRSSFLVSIACFKASPNTELPFGWSSSFASASR